MYVFNVYTHMYRPFVNNVFVIYYASPSYNVFWHLYLPQDKLAVKKKKKKQTVDKLNLGIHQLQVITRKITRELITNNSLSYPKKKKIHVVYYTSHVSVLFLLFPV